MDSKRSSQTWWIAVLVLVVAALVVGEASAQGAVKLSVANWQWTEPGKSDQWRAVFKEYEKTHPNVSVDEVAVPYPRYEDTMNVRMAAGQGPDLVVLNDSMLPKQLQQGNLQPISKLIDTSSMSADFSSLQDAAIQNGELYGFTTEGSIYALLYNPALFQQAGLDPAAPPTTVDQFLSDCKAISGLGSDIIGWGVRDSMNQAGGWWYDYSAWSYSFGARWAKDGKPTINSPENVKALQEFKRVYDSGCVSQGVTSATYRKAFGLGKVGFLTDESAMINIYKSDSPDLKVDTALLPLPEHTTVAEVLYLCISKTAQHPQAAADFIKWFAEPQNYQKWLQTIKSPVGSYKKSVSDAWVADNPWARPFIQEASIGTLSVSPQGLEQYTNDISKIVLTHIEAVLVQNKDIQSELDAAQKDVVAMLNRQGQ